MAHPDLLCAGEPGEHGVGCLVELKRRQAVFALDALADLSAEQVRHQLLPVADAEHRDAQREDGGVHGGALGVVDAARSAGDDEALGSGEFRRRRLAGANLRVHAEVADLPGNQVAILPPGIEDDNLSCRVQLPDGSKSCGASMISTCHGKKHSGCSPAADWQSACRATRSRSAFPPVPIVPGRTYSDMAGTAVVR